MGRCIVTNNAITTLAAAFTAGVSTTFTVLAGKGSLFGAPSSTHPVRVVGIKAGAQNATGQLTDTTKFAVYLATGRSGDVLSGVTYESGNATLSFAVGDTIGVLWTAQSVADLDTDLAAAEAALAAFAPPVLANTGALPAPGVAYRGQIRVVQGAAGVSDDSYWRCILQADSTYTWEQF